MVNENLARAAASDGSWKPLAIVARATIMVMTNRRSLLRGALTALLLGAVPRALWAADDAPQTEADYRLQIATGLVELAPDKIVSTTLYNGQFPGPLLRF